MHAPGVSTAATMLWCTITFERPLLSRLSGLVALQAVWPQLIKSFSDVKENLFRKQVTHVNSGPYKIMLEVQKMRIAVVFLEPSSAMKPWSIRTPPPSRMQNSLKIFSIWLGKTCMARWCSAVWSGGCMHLSMQEASQGVDRKLERNLLSRAMN